MIQALYFCPEFRQGIYNLIPDEIKEEIIEVEIKIDEEEKEKLVSMGFDETKCIQALRKFPKPDQEIQRIEWILSDAPEGNNKNNN